MRQASWLTDGMLKIMYVMPFWKSVVIFLAKDITMDDEGKDKSAEGAKMRALYLALEEELDSHF